MRNKQRPSAVVSGHVIGLAGRGDAAVRLPSGQVAFAGGGAPGDEVVLRNVGKQGGVLRGTIDKIISPGSSRTEPFCEVAQRCGGCSWQHVTVAEQRDQKRLLARRALGELAATAPWLGQLPERAWRRRLRAHLRPVNGQLRPGFLAARSHDLVATDTCPVLVPELSAILAPIATWLGDSVRRAELAAVAGVEGVIAKIHARPSHDAAPPAVGPQQLESLGLVGMQLHFGHTVVQTGLAEVTLAETTDTVAITCSADGFCQAGSQANTAIRQAVAELLATIEPVEQALEFFSGSGNLSFVLAGRAMRVTTVEMDDDAVARAVASLRGASAEQLLETTWTQLGGPAAELVGDLDDAALWLVDPGRPGAKALVEHVANSGPQHIVYVSCAFDTLARDLKRLTEFGYLTVDARLIDTFVHTPHFEIAVLLRRV